MDEHPMVFYLRDEPKLPDPKRLARRASRPHPPKEQTKFRGRPLVCIAVEYVSTPFEFVLSFGVATCSPADLESKGGFSKNQARTIALGRLRKRKMTSSRIVRSSWPDLPPEEFHGRVGMVDVPMEWVETGVAIQRQIVSAIAQSSNGFAPTAQKLARRWLAASYIADIDRRATNQE